MEFTVCMITMKTLRHSQFKWEFLSKEAVTFYNDYTKQRSLFTYYFRGHKSPTINFLLAKVGIYTLMIHKVNKEKHFQWDKTNESKDFRDVIWTNKSTIQREPSPFLLQRRVTEAKIYVNRGTYICPSTKAL